MIDFVYLLIAFAFLLGLSPAALGGLRNARGIFVAYSLAGIFIPGIVAFALGHGGRTDVVELASVDGAKALMLCSIAFVIAVTVSLMTERRSVGADNIGIFRQDGRIANVCAIISIVLSAAYILAMTAQFGGLAAVIERLYQRTNFDDSTANVTQALTQGAFVFAVFSVVFAKGLKGLPFQLSTAAALVFLSLTFVLGGRLFVGLFFVAVFYTTFIRMKLSKAAAVAMAAIMLFSSVSYFMLAGRIEAQGAHVSVSSKGDLTETALIGLTYVDHVAASIEYSRDRGHDYGQLYLNILTSPVPRDLWRNKPLPISIMLREYLYGDTQGGNPPGIFGESYIAFGSFGVMMAAFVLGVLLGKVNVVTTLAIRYDCRMRTALAGIYAPLIGFALVRGGFDVATNRLLVTAFFSLIAVGLSYFISGRPRHQRAAARPVSDDARFSPQVSSGTPG